jgi:hypothetical protein
MTDRIAAEDPRPDGGRRELLAVLATSAVLAVVLTYPFAFQSLHVGRVDSHDGDFSIWNVAWVARTLVVDPVHVLDANIFFPHRRTLIYSESNLGAGILAIPAYWATRNPYFALNFVFLLSLVLSTTGTYYLVRYLVGDRRAAAVAAICFGFCPYVFAHTAQIQLLMTAGLPFTMLAFHRVVDRPSAGRATTLGLVMAAQAIFCGYYAVFVLVFVGFSVLTVTAVRGWWTSSRYLKAMALAAVVAIVAAAPILVAYLQLQRITGFHREFSEAARYSANWQAYFASNAAAHQWLLPLLARWGGWNEVLFPGFVAMLGGAVGLLLGWRRGGQLREAVMIYGGLTVLSCWASFGPQAGLYTLFYRFIPVFSLMRAPARFGVIVALGLAVLTGIAVREWLARVAYPTTFGVLIVLVAAADLAFPLPPFREVPPVSPVYRMLRRFPPGPVIELPFWWRGNELHGHAVYMLSSTTHWMPLINGYSDYIPSDFFDTAGTLSFFPSAESFKLLELRRPRYAVFHMAVYGDQDRADVEGRIAAFSRYLRPVYFDDEETRLYEIVGFPPH